MGNIDDYNAKLDVIQSIPDEEVQTPTIPVDVYLQESENLHHRSIADAVKLATAGITQEMLDDIPVRAGALRESESLWFRDRYTQQQAQKEWLVRSPDAYDMRNQLLHTFRFAFRKDPVLLSRVSDIADGSGHADMIQDLNDLADLLATANGDKVEKNASKTIRDKAYTHLKELVDEVRAAGKYLFWRNPNRLKGYTSEFWKRKNSRKSSAEPEEENEPANE